jgi:hypothetical protein
LGAKHGNGLDFAAVRGKEVVHILQQHHAVARLFEHEAAAVHTVKRDIRIRLVAVEETEFDSFAQDAADLVVDDSFCDGATADRRKKCGRTHE